MCYILIVIANDKQDQVMCDENKRYVKGQQRWWGSLAGNIGDMDERGTEETYGTAFFAEDPFFHLLFRADYGGGRRNFGGDIQDVGKTISCGNREVGNFRAGDRCL